MSGWITDRKPSASELAVTYQPSADYEHRSGEFLVTDGVHVTLDTFELPPGTHRVSGDPYSGYWRAESSGPRWLGWMPKPSPELKMERFLFWQIDNPTVEVCGDLHPRAYMERVLGLKVLEYRGSMMGGFVAVRVAEIPPDLPPFLLEIDDWPKALRNPEVAP